MMTIKARDMLRFMSPIAAALLLVLQFVGSFASNNGSRRYSRSIPRLATRFVPAYEDDDGPSRMSIANMTCDFFTQPLNHFVPRGKSPSFQQRYCVYDGFVSKDDDNDKAPAPILFYTGNESPLEQYINHTGLMWELAPQLNARVVFVEHRYEGQSLPPANLTKDCMSYGSTIQALADYADILQLHLNPHTVDNEVPMAPVIAFGGSYGGMLSAWMRMKYPHLVAGAIAASAPIGGFPQMANRNLDGSARVLTHGLRLMYPPTLSTEKENHCWTNLLATWPLITWLVQGNEDATKSTVGDGKSGSNSVFLQDMFGLCEPYTSNDPEPLMNFAKSLWFDLAEGSFPYPSSYIPFALLHKKVNLPAWPMQAACWKSGLHNNWSIVFDGDMQQVRYNVTYGDSQLVLGVDWGDVALTSAPPDVSLADSSDVVGLLSSVRKAISVWHNITNDVPCYNVSDAAPNKGARIDTVEKLEATTSISRKLRNSRPNEKDKASMCQRKIKDVGSWEPVCCNDEMNLVITEANGLGHDFFWPPSLPRGVNTYSELVQNVTFGPCDDPHGIFGYSTEGYDPWSTWLDAYYGSSKMRGHSNIIFSNGLLDPWAAAGVYAQNPTASTAGYGGLMVQNVTDDDILALIIEYGGHHTDLMYSNKLDPECVTKAREIEKTYISKWIKEWTSSQCTRSI